MRSAHSRSSVRIPGRPLIEVVSGLLLVAVLAVTLLQVAARYLFNWSMPWSEELTRLLFVWMVLIAAVGATHLRIDFLVARMPPALRRWLQLAIAALCAAMLGLMIWKAFGLIELTRNDRYVALGVSVQFLYWAVPIGCGLWLAVIVGSALREFRHHT